MSIDYDKAWAHLQHELFAKAQASKAPGCSGAPVIAMTLLGFSLTIIAERSQKYLQIQRRRNEPYKGKEQLRVERIWPQPHEPADLLIWTVQINGDYKFTIDGGDIVTASELCDRMVKIVCEPDD